MTYKQALSDGLNAGYCLMAATGNDAMLAGGMAGGVPVFMMIVKGESACSALKEFHSGLTVATDINTKGIPPEYPDYGKN